jgi:hypothetical protein
MLHKTWQIVAISLAVALAVGCSRKSGRDKTAPVSGRVTYAGRPVTEGRIMFYPEDGRRMAIGAIDTAGNYFLTTYDRGDGAFLGKHKVVIDAVHEISSGPVSIDEEIGASQAKVERIVPAKYADRKSTPLEEDVKDQNNTINFDIPR